MIKLNATRLVRLLAGIGLLALAACSTSRNDAGATTGTDTAADVAATGDPTAGTTASPAGVPATGTTGGM